MFDFPSCNVVIHYSFSLRFYFFIIINLQMETLIHHFHFISKTIWKTHTIPISVVLKTTIDIKKYYIFLSVSLTPTRWRSRSLQEPDRNCNFPPLKRTHEIQAVNLTFPRIFFCNKFYTFDFRGLALICEACLNKVSLR